MWDVLCNLSVVVEVWRDSKEECSPELAHKLLALIWQCL